MARNGHDPAGETGGDWNVSVETLDHAHWPGISEGQQAGPDLWRFWTADGTRTPSSWEHQLPAGQGRFSVLGTSDSNAPDLGEVTLTPNRVDTRTSAAQVAVRVHAVDVEGVTGVGYYVSTRPTGRVRPVLPLRRPDPHLGHGTGRLLDRHPDLPAGHAASMYYSQAYVRDTRHFRSYAGNGSAYAGTSGQLPLAGDTTVTVVDSSTP